MVVGGCRPGALLIAGALEARSAPTHSGGEIAGYGAMASAGYCSSTRLGTMCVRVVFQFSEVVILLASLPPEPLRTRRHVSQRRESWSLATGLQAQLSPAPGVTSGEVRTSVAEFPTSFW